MDKMQKLFQGKDQPEPSQTWQRETRICECGKQYLTYVNTAGEVRSKVCYTCHDKQREDQRKLDALAKLESTKDDQQERWFYETNMPSGFALKTFEGFDHTLQPKAFNAVKRYVEKRLYNWLEDDKKPQSMVLLSPDIYGVGKTHLVCALINKILNEEPPAFIGRYSNIQCNPCPAYFTTETQLLARIRATYNRQQGQQGETEDDVYQKLERYQLLILDDVGKVRPRDYSFLQGVYFRLIDSRYVDSKPIILTTNLGYDELENHIGGACADRLKEMAPKENFVVMKGKSYRGKI